MDPNKELSYEEEKALTEPQRVQLVKKYMEEGLSEADAAILAGFSTKDFIKLKQSNPKAAMLIARASIRLEHKFLKVITKNAEQDARMATWMLEKKFGDKYNQRARTPNADDGGEGMLASAIKHIQSDESTTQFTGIKKRASKLLAEEGLN
jgi:hypothetical protein